MTLKGLKPLIIQNPFGKITISERVRWSVSKQKLFKKCKRKFFWKYILGIQPRNRAIPLMIGDGVHRSLAEWYRSKRSSMKKIATRYANELEKEAVDHSDFYDQEDYEKLRGLISTLPGMLMGYAKIYKIERMQWQIQRKFIEAEEIINLGKYDFIFKTDLLVIAKNKECLVEHKTAAVIQDSYMERLPLDAQIRGYIFGATHPNGFNLNINKVIYDVIKKCKLRRKSDELIEDYTNRIYIDYIDRPQFYFFRETLRFNKADIKAFAYELDLTHAEYMYVLDSSEDPCDPRCWNISDNICTEFFKTCPFQPLCISGLTKASAHLYKKKEIEEVEGNND